MNKLIKEPLIHFLLIGAVIFLITSMSNEEEIEENTKEIVITNSKINAIAKAYLQERGREPLANELQSLINKEIQEEILYREALAIGLDKNDAVVRRRLTQKMRYLFEDLTVPENPSDEELNLFLKTQASKFKTPESLSFYQIYIDPKKHDNLESDTKQLFAALKDENMDKAMILSDNSFLPYKHTNKIKNDVAKQYGENFAKEVFKAKQNSWQGPLKSEYGLHFVYTFDKKESMVPPLDQIRAKLTREYKFMKQVEANDAFYQKLHDSYVITIENSTQTSKERTN